MFDPSTVCFEIKYPWYRKTSLGKYRDTFIRVWHEDPCIDGSDDSCDWFGRKRKLNANERLISKAIYDLEPILCNRPFYPDHEAFLRFKVLQDAKWQWLMRRRFRWHPRFHFWHWRVQVVPLQHLKRWLFERCCFCAKRFLWRDVVRGNIMGSWSGDSIWHFGCDHNNQVKQNQPAESEGEK